MSPTRILVVDDEADISTVLSVTLRRAGFEVQTAGDGIEAIEAIQREPPDLVILDVMMPRADGLETLKRIREHGPTAQLPVIMLTAKAQLADKIQGFDRGADDYVAKPFRPREVVARVQALLRRAPPQQSAPPPPITLGELEINCWGRSVHLRGHSVDLTATEFRILEVLARSPGRVFTREELLARAFGPDYDGMDRTIDVHVTNLRRKIETNSELRYIVTVHGVGYRLGDPR